MSKANTADDSGHGILEHLISFYRNYYRDDIAKLAQQYPRENRSLYVDWSDLYSFDSDFAHDIRDYPYGDDPSRNFLGELHDALYEFDIPSGDSLESDDFADAHVRVRLPKHQRLGIGEIRDEHKEKYVAIHGQIERVTQKNTRLETVCYECNKCGNEVKVPQPKDSLQEPGSCTGACQGKPSWRKNLDESLTVDERRLKLKQPPDESEGTGEELVVYLQDDLAFADGDRSMMGMAGERVTVHGILKRDEKHTRGRNAKPILGSYVDAHALEFESSVAEDIETEQYEDRIEEHLKAPDTFSRIVESIAPGIKGGERLQEAKKGIAFYLFRAKRKSHDGGAIRGDIHMALIGDPATGKTQLLDFIETVSPRVERLSGTDGTGAGLTTTAEQDDFAGGSWVLKPGLLPRASGGHAIVDEIDKMKSEGVEKLHEALETQRIHVGKAGINATIKTEAGVIVAANPSEGRFVDFGDFVDQIDLDPALFGRFDIIHTLHDIQDETKDRAVATANLSRWQAATNDDEGDGVSGPVDIETMRAWVAIAQELEPELTDEAYNRIEDWYVDERAKDWDTEEDTIPITARGVPAVLRMAEAHARMHFREKIIVRDAEKAIEKMQAVMGDVFLNEKGVPDADAVTSVASKQDGKPQEERIEEIVEQCGGETLTVSEVAVEVQRDFSNVRSDLKTMQGRQAVQVGSNRYKIKELH